MILTRIEKPFLISLQFVPYSPFVWWARVSWSGYTTPSDFDSSFDFTTPNLNEETLDIDVVFVDGRGYTEEISLANCQANEQSFYFDSGNQDLYIHVVHEKRMDASLFSTSETNGFSSEGVFYDDNDLEYLPYLRSSTSITDKADRLVYNKMGFISNSLSFKNGYNRSDDDYEFDFVGDDPFPGSDISILYISQADIEAGQRTPTALYTGYANDDELKYDTYSVKVRDKREQLRKQVPFTVFSSSDYPNISSDVEDQLIPEGYGDIKGAPAYCTNGTITSGTVEYKYCTDGTSITTTYVKTDDAWNSVTPVSTDPTNGELVLSATDARDANGNPKLVKVDARFRNIDDPGDIMKDMISRYLEQEYITKYFNTTQWASEAAYLADIYFYMGERKDFFEWIELIQNASDYGFRFYIDRNGKYTLKVDDINRAVSASYLAIDNVSDSTRSRRDFTDFATSVRVYYSGDVEANMYSYVDNTTYKGETLAKYRFEQDVSFFSNLKTQVAAQNKAARIALDYSEARNNISFTLPEIVYHEIYDIITIDTSVYEAGIKIREYLGVRTLKINSITWDFDKEVTTISGYDITGV